MRRMLTAALAFAALGWGTTSSAQEKLAPPAKSAPHAADCAAPCLEKVCVPAPTKLKISKVEYTCKESDVCLPRCSLGGLLRGRGCDSCQRGHGHDCANPCPPEASCPKCGHPRTVRVLMKRTVTTECPATKCEVSLQPAPPHCPRGAVRHEPCGSTVPAAPTMPRATLGPPQPGPQSAAPAILVEPGR